MCKVFRAIETVKVVERGDAAPGVEGGPVVATGEGLGILGDGRCRDTDGQGREGNDSEFGEHDDYQIWKNDQL